MAHSKRRSYRRHLSVMVPAGLTDVLGALAGLRGQSPSQVVAAIVVANLVDARHDPAVSAAVAARRSRGRLAAVGEGRP